MSWKNLKTFAIFVLIVANIVVGVVLRQEYIKKNYYDEASIYELERILLKSGIVMPREVFPTKRYDLYVYSAGLSDKEMIESASLLTGYGFENDGEGYKSVSSDGVYYLQKDFSISYEAEHVLDSDNLKAEYDEIRIDRIKKAFFDFWNHEKLSYSEKTNGSVVSPEYSIEDLYVDDSVGVYKFDVAEYIDDVKTGNALEVIMNGDKVVSIDGKITCVFPKMKYSAENCDLFSVMIKEKSYFESVGAGKTMVVSSIEYAYDMCFDIFGTAYYIPMCHVVYEDGTIHRYDLVSTELISE